MNLEKLLAMEPAPPPSTPLNGQCWRHNGEVFQVARVERLSTGDISVSLQHLSGDKRRTLRWERLLKRYAYLGDWSVPSGYNIQKVYGVGGWLYVDPFGHVEGAPAGERWTWVQARDAARADAAQRRGG